MRRQFLVPKLWSKLPHSPPVPQDRGRWYIEDCRRVTHCDYLDDSEPILKVEGNSGSDGSKAFCPCNLTFLESVDLLERSFNLSLMTAAVRRPQRKRRRAAAPIFTTRQLLNSAKCQLQNSCRVRGESCTCTWFVHDLNMICTWFVYSMKYSNSQITVHKAPSARMRMTSQGFVVLKWPTVALVEVALAEGMGSPRSGFPPSISLMYNFPSFFLSFSLWFFHKFPSILHQFSQLPRLSKPAEGPAVSAQVDPWEGSPRRVAGEDPENPTPQIHMSSWELWWFNGGFCHIMMMMMTCNVVKPIMNHPPNEH